MKVKAVFPQKNASMEAVGVTRIMARYDNVFSTGLTREEETDPQPLLRKIRASFDKTDSRNGSKYHDEEGETHAMLSSGEFSESYVPSFTSKHDKDVQDICTLLDSKGWNTNTQDFLSNNHTDLSQMAISKVIHRQRSLYVAKNFFVWACRKVGHSSSAYHALLMKLGLNKQHDDAWELLDRMKDNGYQVSETTFCILIKACGAGRNPAMALSAFNKMYDDGVVPGNHSFTTFLAVLFKLNLLGDIHVFYSELIAEVTTLDLQLFSTLIQGFGNMGKIRDAKASFDMMSYYSLKPDISSYNSLIQSLCCSNYLQSAMSAFQAMQESGLRPNATTFNTIIQAFCKNGNMSEAMSVFSDMKKRDNAQPNQATFNILLQGIIAKEYFSLAIDFFRQMSREGFVDTKSCIYLSNMSSQVKQTQELVDLLLEAHYRYRFLNNDISNALIYNLSQMNAIDEATKVFKQMVDAQMHVHLPTYAIMISCYCKAKKLNDAIELLLELRRRGCIPSSCCYGPIIFYLLRENKSTEVRTYLQEMWDAGVDFSHTTYENLLNEICKQSMIEDALKICDIVVAREFTLSVNSVFELMKCLTRERGVEFGISYFRRLYNQRRLLDCTAMSQAFTVISLYSPEKKRHASP